MGRSDLLDTYVCMHEDSQRLSVSADIHQPLLRGGLKRNQKHLVQYIFVSVSTLT